jgi:hypothetical protein
MIREGKAEQFQYVPNTYDGGLREGDITPVFIDGVDPAGSAAAVAADLATHAGLTGTAVHGLGSASTLTAGATGSSLVTSATVDGARAVLGLAAVATPPRIMDFNTATWSATHIVGSGTSGSKQNTSLFPRTGTTANSQIALRINENNMGLGQSSLSFNWSRKINFVTWLRISNTNPTGVFRFIVGKLAGSAFGAIGSENYVGYELQNNVLADVLYCENTATVTRIPVNIVIPSGSIIVIATDGGTMEWWLNGVLVASSTGGPSTDSSGTLFIETENGATPANYDIQISGNVVAY